MAIRDRVRVLIDVGAGEVREEVVEATKEGGGIDVYRADGRTNVTETTRNGLARRTVTVADERVVAIIEEPDRAKEPDASQP